MKKTILKHFTETSSYTLISDDLAFKYTIMRETTNAEINEEQDSTGYLEGEMGRMEVSMPKTVDDRQYIEIIDDKFSIKITDLKSLEEVDLVLSRDKLIKLIEGVSKFDLRDNNSPQLRMF